MITRKGTPLSQPTAIHNIWLYLAISLMVKCESQGEIDALWGKLTADGGREVECGWLKDKFGLSWQIVPSALMEMIKDPDKAKANRAMAAMMKMKKLDLARLEQAYRGS